MEIIPVTGTSRGTHSDKAAVCGKFPIVLFCLWLIPCALAASEFPLVDAALLRIRDYEMAEFAYTRTTTENGSTTVERYDPVLPGESQWKLILLDGASPGEKELRQYAKEKKKERERQQEGDEARPEDIIEGESLRLEEKGEGFIVYSFRGATGRDNPFARMADHLRGNLRVNTRDGFLEFLRMEITEPFSPLLGTKIDSFRVEMSFAPLGSGEKAPVLMRESRFLFSGNVLIKNLEQDVVVRYTDFIYRGDSPGA